MYRLMLADDSSATQKIVTLAFNDSDYQVVCLADGRDVMAYMSHSPVDIILIDVALPGIDGYQLCKKLQQEQLTSAIPVVLMGSIRCPVDEAEMPDFQPAARLEKPFETNQLLELVKSLLADRSNQKHIFWDKKAASEAEEIIVSAVVSSIRSDLQPGTELIEGLGPDQLQAETKSLPRKYLGLDEPVEQEPGRALSEKEYSLVVDLVMEKLAGTLKSVVPEAADEVLKNKRQRSY